MALVFARTALAHAVDVELEHRLGVEGGGRLADEDAQDDAVRK